MNPSGSTRASSSRRPAVALLCPTAWSIRNVVHSGVAEGLMQSGVDVHLIVPEAHRPGTSGFEDATAGIHELLVPPVTREVRGKPTLDALLRASFARRHRLESYRIFRSWERRDEPLRQRIRNAVVDCCALPASRSPVYEWLLATEERWIARTRDERAVTAQLAGLQPDLVISTCCVDMREAAYLRAARSLGVPTLGWILSFDNLTSRGALPVFDAYAVWNDLMRDRILTLYPGRDVTRVHILGTPQFDFHLQSGHRWSRARTLDALELEPDDRYVLYAANSAWVTPTEPLLVEALVARLKEESELTRQRLVVRLHPLDDGTRWEELAQRHPGVRIVKPWGVNGLAPRLGDQALLVSSLLHAEACVNVASTMSLDAAVVGTPVICVGFASSPGSAEDRFYRSVYRTEHYRSIVESGGVRLASDMNELLDGVREAARDRESGRAARLRLVAQECGPNDGRAAERVVALVGRLVGLCSDQQAELERSACPL